MRQRTFLLALLIVIATATAALVPFSVIIMLRNRAHAGSRRIVTRTKQRLVAARDVIAARIRAVTA